MDPRSCVLDSLAELLTLKVKIARVKKAVLDWAKRHEAVDKFGDILLQSGVNDVDSLGKSIARDLNKERARC